MTMEKDFAGGSRPVPDPTLLTTQQLIREIDGLRQVLNAEREGIKEVIRSLREEQSKGAASISDKITALRDLHQEKFNAIQNQFVERDVRTQQIATANSTAINAAMTAAEKAVGEQNKSSSAAIAKSEGLNTQQIAQLGTLIAQNTKTLDEKITDVKNRLTRIEGKGEGKSIVWAALGLIVTIILAAALVAVEFALRK